MRLLFINDQILPSSETDTEQIIDTASALGEAGVEVRLLLPRKGGSPGPSLSDLSSYYDVPLSFEAVTVPSLFPGPRWLEKSAHAAAALTSPSLGWADAVVTRNIPTVAALLRLSPKPVFYETYRPWPDQYPLFRPLFRWLGRAPSLAGGIFHSEHTARSFAGAGFPGEKILVARNGHNPRRTGPPVSPREARKRLGMPAEETVAVYAGHLSNRKGAGALFDLAQSLPEVHFVLVGAENGGKTAKRASSLGNVNLVGWRSKRETVIFLYAADVLIIPPTEIPLRKAGTTVLPLKTYLYLAAGRPILAPNTPDLREVLTHGVNAVLVDPDDIPKAARATRELIADPERRNRLASRARESSRELTYARRAEEILRFTKARLTALGRCG